jgi:hypothetical protein
MRTFLCILPPALLLLVGCVPAAKTSAASEEDAVKAVVADLQKAIKAEDADAIWNLLDADSQADAERQARAAREAHGKADAAGKKELEKRHGFKAAQFASLDGKGYLRSTLLWSELEEVAGSEIKVTVKSKDSAVAKYIDPEDKQEEELDLVKADGKWKVSLQVPKAVER